jgi:hypothetical protein
LTDSEIPFKKDGKVVGYVTYAPPDDKPFVVMTWLEEDIFLVVTDEEAWTEMQRSLDNPNVTIGFE